MRRADNLEDCRAALAGWCMAAPGDSKDLLPWPFACAIACDLFDVDTPPAVQAGQCLLVQFDTYLRPYAAVSLSDFNIMLPPSKSKKVYQKVALLMAPREMAQTTKAGLQDDSIIVGDVNPNRAFVSDLVLVLHLEAT